MLAGEDAAWLHMESPANPMVVNALVELAEPIDLDIALGIADRIGGLPHFGARIAERLGGPPAWDSIAGFRGRDHVERIELEVPGDVALREEIATLIGTPLDTRKPLWRMYVIDRPGSGTLVLFRVHHALADGFALLGVLGSLCDGGAESVAVAPRRARGLRAGAVRGSLRALGHLVGSPADPHTVLKRAPGNDKRVAWSAPLALADVKDIAHATSATVNDVLVALVTGALARYLERRGEHVAELEIHAMVPVNLRRAGESVTVGNDFGLVILGLPIGITDPLARIQAVKARMDAIKGTPEAGVAHGLLRISGWAP
jgi:hypothetical protein